MNIQKLLSQDPSKAVQKAIQFGVRLTFMASDLRKFANHVGVHSIEELKNFCYYKRFFNGGFAASPEYNQANISGDNVHWSNGGVRQLQTSVMKLSHDCGNLGSDLITSKALGRMAEMGIGGLSGEHFTNTDPDAFHCEHTYHVKQISDNLIKEVIENSRRVSPKEMARYVLNHALATTVHNSERTYEQKHHNDNIKVFERYNDGVLQYVDGKLIDVTNATIQEITYNRWNRNPYYKEFIRKFEDLSDKDFEPEFKEEWEGFYVIKPGSTDRRLIEMTDVNLAILARNDSMEIATKFCPDAFKDRWKKNKQFLFYF